MSLGEEKNRGYDSGKLLVAERPGTSLPGEDSNPVMRDRGSVMSEGDGKSRLAALRSLSRRSAAVVLAMKGQRSCSAVTPGEQESPSRDGASMRSAAERELAAASRIEVAETCGSIRHRALRSSSWGGRS